MQLSVGDMDECRDIAAQIQQGMEFDSRFGFAKPSPWEQRQAQVYGGGIQRIDRIVELQAIIVIIAVEPDVQCESVVVLSLCRRASRAPDWRRRRISRDTTGNSDMIEFVRLCLQTGFDVAQNFSIGQLSKCRAAILV